MHSPYHPTRPRCRPSGKFKLLRLIVGIDLLLVLSAAIAAVGYLALITGMYLVVMGQVFPRACASRSAWDRRRRRREAGHYGRAATTGGPETLPCLYTSVHLEVLGPT